MKNSDYETRLEETLKIQYKGNLKKDIKLLKEGDYSKKKDRFLFHKKDPIMRFFFEVLPLVISLFISGTLVISIPAGILLALTYLFMTYCLKISKTYILIKRKRDPLKKQSPGYKN